MPLPLSAAAHIFISVLLLGTLWRVVGYHLLASNSETAQHIGAGMITQY